MPENENFSFYLDALFEQLGLRGTVHFARNLNQYSLEKREGKESKYFSLVASYGLYHKFFFLNTALKTYKAWLGRGPYKNRPHTGFDPQVQICLFLTLKQTSQEHGWLRESLSVAETVVFDTLPNETVV